MRGREINAKGLYRQKLGGCTERFSKYGEKIGRQKHDYVSIHLPRDGEIERIKQERESEHKRSYLRNYSYQELPLEALRELVGVIEKYEKK